jgi:putative transcriptional regulator
MIKCHLSRIMGDRKMTRAALAKLAGLNPHTVQTLYNETSKGIYFDVMEQICRALNVQPGDLFECIPGEAQNSLKTGRK